LGLHSETQAPESQAWVMPHLLLQAPQLFGSVAVFTQLFPHFVVPAVHWQLPLMQLFPGPQTFPHEPQLFASNAVNTQVLLQLVWKG
jgi:hypothetical protein